MNAFDFVDAHNVKSRIFSVFCLELIAFFSIFEVLINRNQSVLRTVNQILFADYYIGF